MAKLHFIADPSAAPAMQTFGLLPTGDYMVMLIETEAKPTRAGKALNLTFKVTEGEYSSRRVWVMLNLSHTDPTVVDRANGLLQTLCKAVGVTGELDTDDLLHKPLLARIYATRPKDGYEPKNSANNFRPANYLYPPDVDPGEGWAGDIPNPNEVQG